jgi:methylglyoxal synthase
MRGWRIESSRVAVGGRVELVARMDRCSIAVLFVNPGQPAGEAADVRHLHTMCDAARVPYAALVTTAACGADALAAVRNPNILLLRYADLERLEDVVGMVSWRQSAALGAGASMF